MSYSLSVKNLQDFSLVFREIGPWNKRKLVTWFPLGETSLIAPLFFFPFMSYLKKRCNYFSNTLSVQSVHIWGVKEESIRKIFQGQSPAFAKQDLIQFYCQILALLFFYMKFHILFFTFSHQKGSLSCLSLSYIPLLFLLRSCEYGSWMLGQGGEQEGPFSEVLLKLQS